MTTKDQQSLVADPSGSWLSRYKRVRGRSLELAGFLSDADASAQSMADASPAKWHLAHTSWFFEEFVVVPAVVGAVRFDSAFAYLFNSYYNAIGKRHPREKRGLLTRPSLATVLAYRDHVDRQMQQVLAAPNAAQAALLHLGLAHEEQHQELLLTDILHLFSESPLQPAFRASELLLTPKESVAPINWVRFDGGLVDIGQNNQAFGFDCEGPHHQAVLRPYCLADRAVTNGDWIAFIEAGAYSQPAIWLSDGFDAVTRHEWSAPLYWHWREGQWWTMTLRGPQPVDRDAPVCHVSFYEADAYASWSGARLPTEQEWEHSATACSLAGNFGDSNRFRPKPQPAQPDQETAQLLGMFGDVWEWTASAFLPYPGFQIADGAVGEYNGKFMSGQMVLRGGSCASSAGHVRASYRNFFQPDKRWQFSGLRLARDTDSRAPSQSYK